MIFRKTTGLMLFLFACLTMAQTNTWVKVTGRDLGNWGFPGIIYASNTDEFVATLGQQPSPGIYSVQVFTHSLGKWINALPNDSLYGSSANASSVDSANGKWADSTGVAYGYGINKGIAGFGWRFGWRTVQGYLRPNTSSDAKALRPYSQFCYNSDDGKIYFYVNNMTFTYAPATRRWDTLSIASHPNGTTPYNDAWNGAYFLKWGSLCFDGYNKEIVLLGGGGIDKTNGEPGGTWTFDPATKSWTALNLAVEPGPRVHSPMAYDPVNRCIVLFGGDHLDNLMNDTWVYDCVTRTWSKKNPAIRPKPRAGHAMLYLPKSGKMVLLGGYRYEADQTKEFEMWTYDIPGNTWNLIKRFSGLETWPKVISYNPAFSGIVSVDKGDTLVALCDSTPSIYGFNPQTLRLACDAAQKDDAGTVANGLARDTVALRTGFANPSWYGEGVAAADTGAAETKLRTLAFATWTPLNPPKIPGGDRTWGTAVYDSDRDIIMRWSGGHAAYCGTDVPHYNLHTNRWSSGYAPEFPLEYDGNNECNPGTVTLNNRPFLSGHTRRCYAYDVNIHRMISVVNLHTYLYNPDSMDWDKTVHIHNAESYSADRGGALCPTLHGAYGYFSAQSYLFSPDSLRWRKLPQVGTLPGFSIDASGIVYDSKRDRILHLFQSYGVSTTPARLYEFDFKTNKAAQLFPSDSVLTTGNSVFRESVYLPKLDMVLFLFFKGSSMLAYDCANNRWILVPVSGVVNSITSAIGSGMVYDSKRDLVWITDNASNNYVLRLDSAATRAEWTAEAPENNALIISPNPFNPAASIILPAAKAAKGEPVTLRIFTANGRCVADLSAECAQNREITWQAAKLSAGVYVVKHAVGKKVWETRAVLVK